MKYRAERSSGRGAMVILVLALLAGGVFSGCAKPAPANLPRVFVSESFDADAPGAYAVDPKSKYATYEAELARYLGKLPRMDHADYAMRAANYMACAEAAGDLTSAAQAAMNSQRVMTGDVRGEKGKAVAAALADESNKVFKGECYEIAMLNSMLGLYSLRMGDPETAAIGFRRAIEADKMSKEGFRDDFRLASWGLGMAYLDLDPTESQVAFRKCGYKSAQVVAKENLVVLVALGRAPWKQLTGLYGEYDKFAMSSYEPRFAEIFVDGESVGRATKLIDLFKQTEGVGRSGKDVGQGAKAVGKAALSLAAGVFLGSSGQDLVESAWSVKADTRTCFMLPNEIHALTAKVAPGAHTVAVKFKNAAGAELPRYEQVWHYVEAPATGRAYLAVRSEFDRCNVQGPIPFTRVNKVKTAKTGPETEVTKVRFRAKNLPGVRVGDTVKVCHFYRVLDNRWDMQYHWRYEPMAYNGKGEPIGHPGARHRMLNYDIGLVGLATVTEIEGETALATMKSLTTEYVPQVDDMVTNVAKAGRLWR